MTMTQVKELLLTQVKKQLLFTFSVSYLQNTILKKGQNTFMTYILFNRFTKIYFSKHRPKYKKHLNHFRKHLNKFTCNLIYIATKYLRKYLP